MKKFIPVVLFLLFLNFLSENIGYFTHEFNAFFALTSLFAFLLFYLPLKNNRIYSKNNIFVLIFFILSIAIYIQGSISKEILYKLIGVALFISSFDILLWNASIRKPELPALLLTTIFYAFFSLFYNYVPPIWFSFQKAAILVSHIIGLIISQPISSGVTYLGMPIVIIFAIFYGTLFLLSQKKKPVDLIIYLLILLLVLIVGSIIQVYLSSKLNIISFKLFEESKNIKIILFILCLPSTYFYFRNVGLDFVSVNRKNRKLKHIAVASLLIALTIVSLTTVLPTRKTGHTILFYDRGLLDWNIPVWGKYGLKSGGMFGLLPKYLNAIGYETKKGVITKESLKDSNCVVVINLMDRLSKNEKRLIWDFVENGGSLLVLGDHTGVKQIREPLNDLLEPVKISFNFDSAIPFETEWHHALELKPHFITKNIFNANKIKIRIGASLTIFPPSRPVIIGKYGFSDQGNINNVKGGYLGNMRYDQGEQLGDLLLVAENSYGKGKVLVFGDTNTFQNGAIVYSYQFINQVFDWLTSQGGGGLYPYNVILSLILFLLLLVYLIKVKLDLVTILFLLIPLYLSYFFTSSILPNFDRRENSTIKENVAYIDISHLERCDLEFSSYNSFGGLGYNLMRNDYLPLVLRKFSEELLNGSILVLIAPTKPFSDDELLILEEFLRRGGFLILTVGWEEGEASQKLLSFFKFNLENVPLGHVDSSQNKEELQFHEAWPIVFDQQESEVLCRVWDYPVIVFSPYQQGGVLFVGDSSFLLNKNLEGLYNYSLPNIMFLKKILNEKLVAIKTKNNL